MMRFGCGAHMVHGRHGCHGHEGHKSGGGAPGSARDPVCGMSVGTGQGYSEVYQGRELRFCSRACLDKFDAQPERYAA
jgi:YHS domain-containing protein